MATRNLPVPRKLDALKRLVPELMDVSGWEQYCSGDLDIAHQLTQQATEDSDADGRAYELLGLIYRDLAMPIRAADAFERASLLLPLYPLSQICLAESYAVLKRSELARDLYLMAADYNRENIDILLLVAAGLEGIDEPRLALDICRRAGMVDPSSGQVIYDMCLYASRCGATVSVIESLAWRAVELEPQNVHFRIGLASLLTRLNQSDKAYSVVQQLSDEQVNEITCLCCLDRIIDLYRQANDFRRVSLCEARTEQLSKKV